MCVKVFFQTCENINLCENKTHPVFICQKALSSLSLSIKIFNIANLRDILYFKLAVNNCTHQIAWKSDKKWNSILPQAQREVSAGNSS